MTTSQLDRSSIVARDPGQVGQSLDRLADQLRDGWRQARPVRLPKSYRQCKNIALCGMGGSHLGADILRSALAKELRVPITIVADYRLPAWVNRDTLVICSSYSGSTEETIAAFTAAQRRHLKIVVMTHGGTLARLAKKHRQPLYQFVDTENPSGQPRLGVAYSLMALVACLRQLHLVSLGTLEIEELPAVAWEATRRYQAKVPAAKNPAKQLAVQLGSAIPLLIGAEWSEGNLHTLNNQINENAKTFVAWYPIPGLNHHLLEGLRNKKLTKQMHAVIFVDDAYDKRNQRRIVLTKQLLNKLGAKISTYRPHGQTALEKAVDLLAFGGYLSWYMAAARKVKPGLIPTVDWLKKELAKK